MTVTAIDKDGLHFNDGTSLFANTVIWTAGVRAVVPPFEGIMPTLTSGRINTDINLSAKGLDSVFVLGDVATPDAPTPVPMLAQVAVAQAKVIANNIIATIDGGPLMAYRNEVKGMLVSLGAWFAAGEIYSMRMWGAMMWWVWRTVYLFKFASWKKRFRIAFEWTTDLFFPRDISKLS